MANEEADYAPLISTAILPEVADHAPDKQSINPEPQGTQSPSRADILIVEDNAQVKAYLTLLLSDHYNITCAENGKQALEILADGSSFDLILSDLMMPVMDGYQLLERLKTSDLYRHLPVIMLTARADIKDRLKALRIGVDDYLLKPFNEMELLARVDNLLKNKNNRKEEPALTPSPDEPSETTQRISSEDQEWLESFERYVMDNHSNPDTFHPLTSIRVCHE